MFLGGGLAVYTSPSFSQTLSLLSHSFAQSGGFSRETHISQFYSRINGNYEEKSLLLLNIPQQRFCSLVNSNSRDVWTCLNSGGHTWRMEGFPCCYIR